MTPFDVLNEVKRRCAEAVIAQSGLAHEGLRRHLRAVLGGDDPGIGAMLQEPVLEGAHPFITADATMAALAGSLLHADLVTALDTLPPDHDYRFPRTRKPFLHQAEAWRFLAEPEPQSVLVTSGTGSGKTECFLFPILSDLVSQAQSKREPLEGVQAIMLYPLNALIESQRERLSVWTQRFGGRIRYCLYNGDLQRIAKESERRRTPEEVIDRERLRASPPPLLVTNVTMLEYMLVRAEDRPIIDASQGKLKWIVLDEAHSLVGAAAAEIALLLRRVLLAFSVKPEEVRFVATSATIGSGENVLQQLQRFLADVAGIPDNRVQVIDGRRRMPRRPDGTPRQPSVDIRGMDPALLYDILGRDPTTWRLVERLFNGSVPLADFDAPAMNYGVDAPDLIFAMSRAARKTADKEEERLAPIRLHAFERAVPGIWSCINPECAQRPLDWPFGRILPERADECPSCGAPVLEVVSCFECGEVFLEGIEAGPRLSAPLRNPPRDEFAFDSERENDRGAEDADDAENDVEQQEKPPAWERLFAANPTQAARGFWLDRKASWRVADRLADGGLALRYEEHHGLSVCPHCSPKGRKGPQLIRPLRFGAPFILGNAAPILLEGVESATAEAGDRLPSAGRRLLSFTDSRQGTARMAAKLQIESERNFVRSFVSTAGAYAGSLTMLTRRSVLEGDQSLVEDAKRLINELASGFVAEWEGLIALAKDEGLQDAGKSRMAIELRRLCGEFLLGSLADRGFLPGHGFPTDVVSFMPGKEFKSPQDVPAEGARQFRTVGPQRSLDLAIRDYAPGSEVVLDGLVYRSAGVTLNWKRPANEDHVAEVQSLRFLWRCVACGASDIKRGGSPDCCPVCGSERLNSQEFLRPAGFSVDPRVRAHADTDTLSYVAPEDPVVSTRDAIWLSLPVPEFGRYRCSREGLVYYSNRGGSGGFGYAVCLQCGRAEADSDNRGLPTPAAALVDHKPLRYRKGQDLCPGNEKPFSIKRNISLGLEVTTDVFELQLQHPLRRAGANALVIALREALTQELGVEADEMGFAVSQTQNALGAPAISLFLFDRAAGGAGFAVSFQHLMRSVICRAEQILDCETPGCEKACAACVLTPDAPSGKDELDRTAALAFLRVHLAFPEELRPGDRFVDGANLSLAPLDEIHFELLRSAGSTLTVFLPDRTNPAALQDWPLATQLLDWRKRGHETRLALAPALVTTLSPAEKLSLRDFALQNNVGLVTAEAPVFANGAHMVAMVCREGGPSRIWATREAEPRLPGPAWGCPVGHSVAEGSASIAVQFAAVDLDALLPPPGAQLIQIGPELDCDLATFSGRASKLIAELLRKCGSWSKAGIVQAVYRDSFVSSPLVARLLIDTTKQIFSQSGAAEPTLIIETRPPRAKDVRGDPWQVWHDWREAADQKAVIEMFGKQRGLHVSLRQKEVPHGRYLDVNFADGNAATIVLDQGFGAWAPPRHVTVRYDFGADVTAQVKRLATVNAILERRGIGKTYLVATSAKM
jgi:hypothetical protein